jgi:hypothetical protein
MKRIVWSLLTLFLFLFLGARPAAAEQRFIVRTNQGLPAVQELCLLEACKVVGSLDGTVNQLFLITTSDAIDPQAFLAILRAAPGIVDAEVDQLFRLVPGLTHLTTIPNGLWQRGLVNYSGAPVWSGYVNQPASEIVRVAEAQSEFKVKGAGIVADIDTGVDPTHPALRGVLLPGYDFTRNRSGASELADFSQPIVAACNNCQPAYVNQSTAAVLDQSTAAVLDGSPYAAFGHGTMVVGIIHLVAPEAQILPLKAFRADGTGYLSDILRALHYAVQNQARIINMSFDFTSYSPELARAIGYANRNNVICVASAGNDGKDELVYPAALRNVMGIASTSDIDTRSTFSNYGDVVWVAAPGEEIVTTYPFGTYAASSGTSFSAPFVSGGSALLVDLWNKTNPHDAAGAIAHARTLSPELGHGRLDLVLALGALRHRKSSGQQVGSDR